MKQLTRILPLMLAAAPQLALLPRNIATNAASQPARFYRITQP